MAHLRSRIRKEERAAGEYLTDGKQLFYLEAKLDDPELATCPGKSRVIFLVEVNSARGSSSRQMTEDEVGKLQPVRAPRG